MSEEVVILLSKLRELSKGMREVLKQREEHDGSCT